MEIDDISLDIPPSAANGPSSAAELKRKGSNSTRPIFGPLRTEENKFLSWIYIYFYKKRSTIKSRRERRAVELVSRA
jgi:hypothetical protein